MKVTNPTGVWDVELTWYSLSASLAWSNTSDYLVIGLLDLSWLSRFLHPKQNVWLLTVLWSTELSLFFKTNVFGCFWGIVAQFKPTKHKFSNISVQLLSLTPSEAMHNLSVHQWPQYYESQQVLSTPWTTSVTYQNISKLLTHPSIYPTHPPQAGCDARSIFFCWFEFRVFLCLDWLLYKG